MTVAEDAQAATQVSVGAVSSQSRTFRMVPPAMPEVSNWARGRGTSFTNDHWNDQNHHKHHRIASHHTTGDTNQGDTP